MARERMVTRTVEMTTAEVMTVDTTTAKVETIKYELAGGFTDEKDILKTVKRMYETDTFKCVSVVNVTVKEILYGMLEYQFIQHATIMPPRTKIEE